MSAKKIKAVKGWSGAHVVYFRPTPETRATGLLPVYVLPATVEAYEQMVEQIQNDMRRAINAAIACGELTGKIDITYLAELAAVVAPAAIGIKPPKKGRT